MFIYPFYLPSSFILNHVLCCQTVPKKWPFYSKNILVLNFFPKFWFAAKTRARKFFFFQFQRMRRVNRIFFSLLSSRKKFQLVFFMFPHFKKWYIAFRFDTSCSLPQVVTSLLDKKINTLTLSAKVGSNQNPHQENVSNCQIYYFDELTMTFIYFFFLFESFLSFVRTRSTTLYLHFK